MCQSLHIAAMRRDTAESMEKMSNQIMFQLAFFCRVAVSFMISVCNFSFNFAKQGREETSSLTGLEWNHMIQYLPCRSLV